MTGANQCPRAFYLDYTNTAGSNGEQLRSMTQSGNIDTVFLGNLQDGHPITTRHLGAIYCYRYLPHLFLGSYLRNAYTILNEITKPFIVRLDFTTTLSS